MTRIGIASHDRNLRTWGGSGWARIGQYLPYLREAGYEVVIGVPRSHKTRPGLGLLVEGASETDWDLDVVLTQRVMTEGFEKAVRRARAAGQTILADVDDDLWHLSRSNISARTMSAQANPQHYAASLRQMTAITVSTETLEDQLRNLGVKVPIYVLPHTVDVARFTPREHRDGLPVVGWVGATAFRSNDVETIGSVLAPMVRAGDIALHHAGHQLGAPHMADLLGLPRELVTTAPGCRPEDYPSLMTFDIGVAPLSDCVFNLAKTPAKCMELACAAIPSVATNLRPYHDLGQRGVIRLASTSREWRRHLEELSFPNVRRAEGLAARAEMLARHDIRFGAARLLALLRSYAPATLSTAM